jgi:hypothetical protein
MNELTNVLNFCWSSDLIHGNKLAYSSKIAMGLTDLLAKNVPDSDLLRTNLELDSPRRPQKLLSLRAYTNSSVIRRILKRSRNPPNYLCKQCARYI